MGKVPTLKFKIATESREFEQIHKLNYKTFVEEIPQHETNPDKVLVDRFHDENTYIISLDGHRLAGMMAVRSRRPFSLDYKLENLDEYLPAGRSVCEIRLLAVDRKYRKGRVFFGLARKLAEYGRRHGYDLAVISGTTRQQKLYKHIGFEPFGPLVGRPGAMFQPMFLTLEAVEKKVGMLLPASHFNGMAEPESFLPGPVNIREEVRRELGGVPVSHRSRTFMEEFWNIQRCLCRLVSSKKVEIFVGSGTLANDVIAGQLSLLHGTGLLLSNGEFGRRLVDHARRSGLSFEILQKDWGDIFTRDEIERSINRNRSIEWLWAVHCETSTTVMNDIILLKEICAGKEIKLCLDCISSIGTVPVDLSGVFLASGVSGKGLGAFPGLSMVFYNHKVMPAPLALPRYLDLGTYAACDGVPYTHSSNLLSALQRALEQFFSDDPFEHLKELSAWLRAELKRMGFHLVGPEAISSPAIVTIDLPKGISSETVGDRMEEAGFLLSYRSGYLLERNWLQICLMGESSKEKLVPVLKALKELAQPECDSWERAVENKYGQGRSLSSSYGPCLS